MTPEQQTELASLRVELERALDMEQRAAACILDLRATITRLMGELQTVAAERDAARRELDATRRTREERE